jgi:ABC-type Fe3+ transport system permease subunit
MSELKQDLLSGGELELDNEVKYRLNEAARWGNFISIVMFVFAGLILLMGFVAGSILNDALKKLGAEYEFLNEINSSAIFAVAFAIVAVIVAVVYYFLFAFGKKTKAALLSENLTELNAGLGSLKVFFIITTIISIGFLLISIINLF